MTPSIRAAFLAAPLATALSMPAFAADVTVKPVLSKDLPNVPGKAITMVRVTIAPGGASPAHHHAGVVAVYVLKGSIRSQVGDEALKTYAAGDTFFEPPGARHAVSANPSKSETAEILAVFVADQGATLTTFDK